MPRRNGNWMGGGDDPYNSEPCLGCGNEPRECVCGESDTDDDWDDLLDLEEWDDLDEDDGNPIDADMTVGWPEEEDPND